MVELAVCLPNGLISLPPSIFQVFQEETPVGELSTFAQTQKLVPETMVPGYSTQIYRSTTSGAILGCGQDLLSLDIDPCATVRLAVNPCGHLSKTQIQWRDTDTDDPYCY